MRRAARVDSNQSDIVGVLRAAGASVWIIGRPLDLLIGYQGVTAVAEVKDGKKPPSARQLRPIQSEFMESWKGGIVATLTDVEGALRLLRVMSNVRGNARPTAAQEHEDGRE